MNGTFKCPFCDANINLLRSHQYECGRCGKFKLSSDLARFLHGYIGKFGDPWIDKVKISHAIRRMQERELNPYLTCEIVEKILEKDLPSLKEQADLLVRWMGNNIRYVGDPIHINPVEHSSVVGATTDEGFRLIVEYLLKKELVQGKALINDSWGITLTMDGWEYFDELKHGAITNRNAFMAMQYGDDLLETIYQNVFKKAVDETGFKLYKSNENPKAGLIDNKMRVEIQNAALIIADLTHDNFGAYWEAGYAEGLGKDVIYTCEIKKFDDMKTHFDTNHHLTILWDEEEPEKAGEELKASIRATLPHLAKMEDE